MARHLLVLAFEFIRIPARGARTVITTSRPLINVIAPYYALSTVLDRPLLELLMRFSFGYTFVYEMRYTGFNAKIPNTTEIVPFMKEQMRNLRCLELSAFGDTDRVNRVTNTDSVLNSCIHCCVQMVAAVGDRLEKLVFQDFKIRAASPQMEQFQCMFETIGSGLTTLELCHFVIYFRAPTVRPWDENGNTIPLGDDDDENCVPPENVIGESFPAGLLFLTPRLKKSLQRLVLDVRIERDHHHYTRDSSVHKTWTANEMEAICSCANLHTLLLSADTSSYNRKFVFAPGSIQPLSKLRESLRELCLQTDGEKVAVAAVAAGGGGGNTDNTNNRAVHAEIVSAVSQLRYLQSLVLHFPQLDSASLQQVVTELPSLRQLSIGSNKSINGDEAVCSVAKSCPQLRSVTLPVMNDALAAALAEYCPWLTRLKVQDAPKISINAWKSFASMSRLRDLYLSGLEHVRGDELLAFVGAPASRSLITLNIDECDFSAQTLRTFVTSMSALRKFDIFTFGEKDAINQRSCDSLSLETGVRVTYSDFGALFD